MSEVPLQADLGRIVPWAMRHPHRDARRYTHRDNVRIVLAAMSSGRLRVSCDRLSSQRAVCPPLLPSSTWRRRASDPLCTPPMRIDVHGSSWSSDSGKPAIHLREP